LRGIFRLRDSSSSSSLDREACGRREEKEGECVRIGTLGARSSNLIRERLIQKKEFFDTGGI